MAPLVVVAKAEVVEDAPREERREQPRADRGDRRRDDRSASRGETRGERPDDARSDRREPREERRDDRRDDRRDYRRDRDLGPSVIGMGDHVPDFILRSFALKPTKVEELEDAATGTEG